MKVPSRTNPRFDLKNTISVATNEPGRWEDCPGEAETANGHKIEGGTHQSPQARPRLWSAATDEVKRGLRKKPWKKRQKSSRASRLSPSI